MINKLELKAGKYVVGSPDQLLYKSAQECIASWGDHTKDNPTIVSIPTGCADAPRVGMVMLTVDTDEPYSYKVDQTGIPCDAETSRIVNLGPAICIVPRNACVYGGREARPVYNIPDNARAFNTTFDISVTYDTEKKELTIGTELGNTLEQQLLSIRAIPKTEATPPEYLGYMKKPTAWERMPRGEWVICDPLVQLDIKYITRLSRYHEAVKYVTGKNPFDMYVIPTRNVDFVSCGKWHASSEESGFLVIVPYSFCKDPEGDGAIPFSAPDGFRVRYTRGPELIEIQDKKGTPIHTLSVYDKYNPTDQQQP
ncbi:MAG: hypothetical protein RR382_00550 [Tannerellaceae bacterium]